VLRLASHWPWSPLGALLSLSMAATVACSRSSATADGGVTTAGGPRSSASGKTTAAGASSQRFVVSWSPTTGKGKISQHYDDGATAHLCLQCSYPGYTGGLVIGSYSGSGFEYVPPSPIRGFASWNVFCAQDESIWDQASAREYSFGWSENFGTGPDGERLEYSGGAVEEQGPNRVVLRARNRGGCYTVAKRLVWPAEARFILVATGITNTCREPVVFDFWTGDDPWLGKYRSSEGDVGYTDSELLRVETKVDPASFSFGGVYDLGNSQAGEREGSFSGAANFIMLAPAQPAPDRIYFANRFAHKDDELQAGRPLDNKTMLAFNLGWLDLELAAQETLSFGYALGLAHSEGKPEPPKAPTIPAEAWQSLSPRPHPRRSLRFDREHIELTVTADHLDVTGRYGLANDGALPRQIGIFYPFPSDADHPVPDYVKLDGLPLQRFSAQGARWPLRLPPRGDKSFTVSYRQRHKSKQATYIVTSAARWGTPIRQAEFVIRYPVTFRNVKISFPSDSLRQAGGQMVYQFARAPFAPDRDVVITWN
jgi:hypothetical protein